VIVNLDQHRRGAYNQVVALPQHASKQMLYLSLQAKRKTSMSEKSLSCNKKNRQRIAKECILLAADLKD
jgi:hypothetical protein